MDINFVPILVVPAVPYKNGIRFLHQKNQIDLAPEMANKVWEVLSYANGYNNISTIIELSKLPEMEVLEIFTELNDMGLVVDSRYQFMHFHHISNYPSAINTNLTQNEIEAYTKSKRLETKTGKVFGFETDMNSALLPIRTKRRSCRSFAKTKLTINQIGSICNFAYSIPGHSVPSGGALYPLKIYVLIEEDQVGIKSGYYEYNAEQNNFILFNNDVDIEQLKYCFNQEEMPFGSSIQIIIAADLNRQPYKYANRGYRLTLIEAGHAAENISLYCAEKGLGSCEMGGVQDEPLKQELNLDENVWPLLAIPIGFPANSETEQFNKIRFVEEKVNKSQPVKQVWTKVFDKDGSFFGATTTYLDEEGNIQYAGATSPSYADAIFKATIEGYERWFSSQVRVDFHGSANQVPGKWLDPNSIISLTLEQTKKCGVKPFTKDLAIDWTKGTNYNGAAIYVPSDMVYYGQKSSENRIYFGNSSGTAAHFNYDEAKKRAVIELIERDALMLNWYYQESPNVIDEKILPIHIKNRIKHWAKQNRKMFVLQIPSDFGNVFEVIIISKEYPCFISGAAATIDKKSINDAILKASREAEYNLLLALSYPDKTPVNPISVLTPYDHGKVYYFKENANKLRWLWKKNRNTSERLSIVDIETKYGGFERFCNETLNLVTINLSPNNSDLNVVRVFSPFLVPINFGFYTAHYTNPIVKFAGGAHPNSLKMPHYFA